jgi:hypothetical protein
LYICRVVFAISKTCRRLHHFTIFTTGAFTIEIFFFCVLGWAHLGAEARLRLSTVSAGEKLHFLLIPPDELVVSGG